MIAVGPVIESVIRIIIIIFKFQAICQHFRKPSFLKPVIFIKLKKFLKEELP